MPERLSLEYENLSRKWSEVAPDYHKQYFNIYLARLKEMTALLEVNIAKKWGTQYPICKLHKLSEENHPKCVVIGTLFKNQKLKPSILKQLAEEDQLVPQPIVTHFTDKSDELFIEDELQRYLIISCIPCDYLVTGISCALLGTADDKGRFIVEDYTFADFRPQIPRPLLDDSAFVIFLSGLDLVNSPQCDLNLQLFTFWLSGLCDVAPFRASKITRVIIAGNSIRNTPEQVKPSISMLSRRPESSDSIDAVKLLDKFLLQLGQVIDVDVMPGENDPSNRILPQKPMHRCMFPQSGVYKSVNQVSNPYFYSLGGVRILGTSGQPVRDVMRYCEITDPLEVLENCLKWGHLAPTAPDTLGCFPFYDSDPFIIEECPHVFFAGNQEKFSARECTGPDGQKVTLISVPEFSRTLQGCILNLKTMECNSISFQTV
ncbi:DNA polymerase delta subunit 2 [Tribolium castaneum]|uniref:DNA polymerase delta subunit 2 n=1 Tax=Tribolium castaneum TaxID=7070 RepID=UPI00077DE426|nr:PREDICTED: LOW QUALITY PROTEIN: DNA polymerase delta subunit 2 [Tribolium castaneum]|eukprot:XP_015838416.1 PREDICTED: LOW QUALITY PROTEIN: DNA polymerase delta subunit 2 [Tribolium castaneum]